MGLSKVMNIMVGVAGSGKSTIAKKINELWFRRDFVIISPDELREQFNNGNRSDQSKNNIVWEEAYRLVHEAIKNNKDIIFDATMLTPKARKKLVSIAKRANMYLIANVVERDLDIIIEQNKNRKWPVPEHIVKNMFNSYIEPTLEEGFDKIIKY